MSFWRHAPAIATAALAAAAMGTSWQRERAHGAELQALTRQLSMLRADVASLDDAGRVEGRTQAAPARCSYDADTVQALSAAVAATLRNTQPTTTVKPETPAARTAEQDEALVRATDMVDSFIASGRMSLADQNALGAASAAAGAPREALALRAKIAQAVNEGKLVVERPPFINR
jgi:hypothetical protein